MCRPRSPSSSRSTPNTRSISTARPPTSSPIGATRASSCRNISITPSLPGLSNEARQKLQAHRPRTIGQAGRIDGITPAALTLLVAHVRRQPRAAPQPDRGVSPCPKPRTRSGRPSNWPRIERLRRHSSLFHVKHSRGSIVSSRFCCRVAAHTNLIAPLDHPAPLDPAHRRFAAAPGAGAERPDLGRSRLRRRLSRAGPRVRAGRPAGSDRSIWSRAFRRRPRSCAKPRSTLQVPATVHAVRIEDFGKNSQLQGRCRHRACARSAKPTPEARVPVASKRVRKVCFRRDKM